MVEKRARVCIHMIVNRVELLSPGNAQEKTNQLRLALQELNLALEIDQYTDKPPTLVKFLR